MNIAFNGNELFVFVGVGKRRRFRRLDAAPFAIHLGERMDVVSYWVAIPDLDLLTDSDRENMHLVAAAFLIEGRSAGRAHIGIRLASGDVHDHIG
ncbi:MAG: hypothetical protein WA830_23245 [Candidatus Sulfotelmatobacter sp.]